MVGAVLFACFCCAGIALNLIAIVAVLFSGAKTVSAGVPLSFGGREDVVRGMSIGRTACIALAVLYLHQ